MTFIENTKDFLFLFIPSTVVIFALLNRLSKLLVKFRVGRIFINFSFWIYFVVIVVFNDVQKLSYLSFMQLANLYRFKFTGALLQAASITLIGLWLLLCCSLYLMCCYFHTKTTIDMGNFRCTLSSLFLVTFKYALKPVVQGAIHYLVWSNTLLQISLLFSVEIVSFFLCAYSQMRKKIVKIKTVFSIECILDAIAAFLNLLIYLKYIFLENFID